MPRAYNALPPARPARVFEHCLELGAHGQRLHRVAREQWAFFAVPCAVQEHNCPDPMRTRAALVCG